MKAYSKRLLEVNFGKKFRKAQIMVNKKFIVFTETSRQRKQYLAPPAWKFKIGFENKRNLKNFMNKTLKWLKRYSILAGQLKQIQK